MTVLLISVFVCLRESRLAGRRRLYDQCGSSVIASFCPSFCVQYYCNSNQPISVKLDVVMWPTNWNNCLTFGGDLVPGTDSRSLFHFPHHCKIGDFRRFINIFHTVTDRFSRQSAK